jgi:hypothetical protein
MNALGELARMTRDIDWTVRPWTMGVEPDLWERGFDEMAEWCGEHYGAPVPFTSPDVDAPNFLVKGVAVVMKAEAS